MAKTLVLGEVEAEWPAPAAQLIQTIRAPDADGGRVVTSPHCVALQHVHPDVPKTLLAAT